MIYIFHPYFTAPLILLFYILHNPSSKFLQTISIFTSFLYFLLATALIPWPDFGSYWLITLYPTAFIFITILKIKNFRNLPSHTKISILNIIFLVLKSILLLFLINETGRYISTFKTNQHQTFRIDSPLKGGIFYIHQGGTNQITNYHNSGYSSKFAMDIDKINIFGLLTHRFNKNENPNNYLIFRDTVYAPCCGKIVSVVDSIKDHGVGSKNNFSVYSNQIAIDCEGIVIKMLHLHKKTAMVSVFDTVYSGQPIGLIGNSGFSSRPHLHIEGFISESPNHAVILKFKGFPYPVRNMIYKN